MKPAGQPEQAGCGEKPISHVQWMLVYMFLLVIVFKSEAHKCKDFWKRPKTCHVGIHWIALAEYSQMSTHVPGFQSFFRFFASFCIGQISNHQHKG